MMTPVLGTSCYELTDEVSREPFLSETNEDFFNWPRKKSETILPPYFCEDVVDAILPEDINGTGANGSNISTDGTNSTKCPKHPSQDICQEKQSSPNKLESNFIKTPIQNVRQIISIGRQETVFVDINNIEDEIESDFESPESWESATYSLETCMSKEIVSCPNVGVSKQDRKSLKKISFKGRKSDKSKEEVVKKRLKECKTMKECYINIEKVNIASDRFEDIDMNVNSTKSKPIRHNCEFCDYEVASKWQLKIHIDAEHNGIRYYCDQCPFEAKNKRAVQRHVDSIHDGISFKCDDCDYQAKTKWNLKRHIETIHGGISFKCDDCDYQTKTKWNLKRHIETIHGGIRYNYDGIRYKCDECDYQGPNKLQLKRHVEITHNGNRFKCEYCQFITLKSRYLEKHIQFRHKHKDQFNQE